MIIPCQVFAKIVNYIVSILEPESGCPVNCFSNDSMIVKRDKFQAILLDKRNFDLYLNKTITIDKENIKVVSNARCSY